MMLTAIVAVGWFGPTSGNVHVGQLAPSFESKDQLGITRKLEDYRGKTVVLAFFPGDFTPGCTAEVRAFRNTMPKIENRDAIVFGISGNDLATRQRFATQERLNFPLLIDEKNDLANLYGVAVNQGRPQRMTVIIGPDGRIVGVDRDVDRQFYKSGDALATHHADNLALFLSDWNGELGQTIPPFWLEGEKETISTFRPDAKAEVFWFVDAACPVTAKYAKTMSEMKKDPKLTGVSWVQIASRPNAKPTQEIGVDRDAVSAKRFGATETGEVWVTDREGRVIYRGAIDAAKGEPDGRLLREALYATLSGRPVPVKEYHGTMRGLPIGD